MLLKIVLVNFIVTNTLDSFMWLTLMSDALVLTKTTGRYTCAFGGHEKVDGLKHAVLMIIPNSDKKYF